mgnify:CR=1 FL=1
MKKIDHIAIQVDDVKESVKWYVEKYDIGTYEVTGFDKERNPVTITMYRSKAFLNVRYYIKMNLGPSYNSIT